MFRGNAAAVVFNADKYVVIVAGAGLNVDLWLSTVGKGMHDGVIYDVHQHLCQRAGEAFHLQAGGCFFAQLYLGFT